MHAGRESRKKSPLAGSSVLFSFDFQFLTHHRQILCDASLSFFMLFARTLGLARRSPLLLRPRRGGRRCLSSTSSSVHGLPVTARETDNAARLYDVGLDDYLGFRGAAASTLESATSADPTFAMGHVLYAALHLMSPFKRAHGSSRAVEGMRTAALLATATGESGAGGGGGGGGSAAAAAADDDDDDDAHGDHSDDGPPSASPAAAPPASPSGPSSTPLTEWERMHVCAMSEWVRGRPRAAAGLYEAILARQPLDLLALRCAHDIYLSLGDRVNLRGSVSRVLQSWRPDVPGYHYVLSMHAYALQEAGVLQEAEDSALRALESSPADCWAVHAAVHVMEAEGRGRESFALLRDTQEYWRECRHIRTHLEGHWAACLLDQGYRNKALLHYDDCIASPAGIGAFGEDGARTTEADRGHLGHHFPDQMGASASDLSAAANTLWRLELFGEEVGAHRWEALAAKLDGLDRPAPWRGWEPGPAAVGVAWSMAVAACGRTMEVRQQAASAAAEEASAAEEKKDEQVHLEAPWTGIPFSASLSDATGVVNEEGFAAAAGAAETTTAVQDGGNDDVLAAARVQAIVADAMAKFKDGDASGAARTLLPARNHLGVAGMGYVDSRVVNQVRLLLTAILSAGLPLSLSDAHLPPTTPYRHPPPLPNPPPICGSRPYPCSVPLKERGRLPFPVC